MASAAGSIQVAIWEAIMGDAVISAKLAGVKVHNFVAAEGAPMPFIVLRNSAEENFNVFRRKGKLGAEDIGIHSARMDKREVLDLYNDLERILNGTILSVAGHTMVKGMLILIAIIPDEVQGVQLLARYTPTTQEG